MRAYWARGTSSLDEILEMLDESLHLADELGDIETAGGGHASGGSRR